MQERQCETEQAVRQVLSSLSESECENVFVSEPLSVFGSVFEPDCWFVCVCELSASAWHAAVAMEGHLQLGDCRAAGSCSVSEAQLNY